MPPKPAPSSLSSDTWRPAASRACIMAAAAVEMRLGDNKGAGGRRDRIRGPRWRPGAKSGGELRAQMRKAEAKAEAEEEADKKATANANAAGLAQLGCGCARRASSELRRAREQEARQTITSQTRRPGKRRDGLQAARRERQKGQDGQEGNANEEACFLSTRRRSSACVPDCCVSGLLPAPTPPPLLLLLLLPFLPRLLLLLLLLLLLSLPLLPETVKPLAMTGHSWRCCLQRAACRPWC